MRQKKDSQVMSIFFTILGSAHIKAARKTLVKLPPEELLRSRERQIFAM